MQPYLCEKWQKGWVELVVKIRVVRILSGGDIKHVTDLIPTLIIG